MILDKLMVNCDSCGFSRKWSDRKFKITHGSAYGGEWTECFCSYCWKFNKHDNIGLSEKWKRKEENK